MNDRTLIFEIPMSNLGDTIVGLSCIPYIMKINEDFKEYYIKYNYTSNYNDIVKFSELNDIAKVSPFNNKIEGKTNTIVITNERTGNGKIHIIDSCFKMVYGMYSDIPIELKNYIKYNNSIPENIIKLPKKYAVIHTTFLDLRRSISIENINSIIDYLTELSITPILVGSKYNSMSIHLNTKRYKYPYHTYGIGINYDKCMNLIGRTSLHELTYIISKSKMAIVPDSGILHLAGMTDVPILSFFTSTAPKYRLPIRNNTIGHNCKVISSTVECRGCINHHGYEYPCPYKSSPICIKFIESEEIIEKIKSIISA